MLTNSERWSSVAEAEDAPGAVVAVEKLPAKGTSDPDLIIANGEARHPDGPQARIFGHPVLDLAVFLAVRPERPRFYAQIPPKVWPKMPGLDAISPLVATYRDYCRARVLRRELSVLPWDEVASGKVAEFAELTEYCKSHPILQERFAPLAEAGQSVYPEFLSFWRREVRAETEARAQAYLEDWQSADITATYERITRLEYKCGNIDVWLSPFFPTASNFNTRRGTLVRGPTSARMPLSWLLGHELTHPQIGHEGWRRTDGVRHFRERGLDVEEALCLCLQNQLALACGHTEHKQRLSARSYSRVTNLLMDRWDHYLADPERYPTILDFLSEAGHDALEGGEIPDERLASRVEELAAALKEPSPESLLPLYRPQQQNEEQRRKQVDLWVALFGSANFAVQEVTVGEAQVANDRATISATVHYRRRVGPKYGQGWLREFETTRWAIHDGEWHFVGFSRHESEITDFELQEPRDTSGMAPREVTIEFVRTMVEDQDIDSGLALTTSWIDGSQAGKAMRLIMKQRLSRIVAMYKKWLAGEIGEPEPATRNGRTIPNMVIVPIRNERGTHRLWLRKTDRGYKVSGGF